MKNYTLALLLIVFFTVTNSFAQGQLEVRGLGVLITNGDTTPSITDDSDFGTIAIGNSNANAFEISNVGDSNLNNITITITGAGASSFSPASSNIGKIKNNKKANHTITYSPTTSGPHIATVTITSSDTGVDVPYSFTIQGNTPFIGPEINLVGNSNSIASGDVTPSTADDTDFGNADITVGSVVHTFTIQNTGGANLNLTGASPFVNISGANAADFTVSTAPSSIIGASSSTTFNITFNPTIIGIKNATITIANDDSDESPYTFSIRGNATTTAPEINLVGNTNSITTGDTTPTTTDDTDFGNTDITVGSTTHTFTIQNTGDGNLNLTGASPYVVITGANAADFTVSATPSATIGATSSTTFNITFNPTTTGIKNASISIANNDSDENPYTFSIQGNGTTPSPEIDIQGNTNTISDGDITPNISDDTDFGSVDIAGGTNTNVFTIQNTGTLNLTITGLFPYVTIGGANPLDFLLTALPNTSISPAGSTTFAITFNPNALGLRTANVTIANNDSDENPYNFNIQGTGFIPPPCGSSTFHIATFESGLDGWTSGGVDAARINDATWAYNGSFSLRVRDDDASGNASSFLSPVFDFTNYDKVDFKFFFKPQSMESSHNGAGTKTYTEDFFIEYSNDGGTSWTVISTYESGIVAGNKTGDFDTSNTAIGYGRITTLFATDFSFSTSSRFRVRCDASEDDDMVYIDDITISGTSFCTPTEAPGGVTAGLDLWLKADQLDGTTYAADGAAVSQWADNGKGNNANVMVTGQEPVYRNNVTGNFNFNPVIEFDNDNTTANSDMTYIINDGSRKELQGTGGFNTNDVFIILMPDPTITNTMIPLDTFTSSDPNTLQYAEDVTGFGYGSYTARFVGERLSFCIGTTSETPTNPAENGYGRADSNSGTDYNKIQIVNVRQNSSDTDMELYSNAIQVGNETNDIAKYAMINNARFWLGRSQYWNGSFDGRIAEVITYNSRKTDATLTEERNRIQSYLAIKYGITLGVNGTTQDYVNNDGDVIWDQSANTGYNFDIAGIGRDNASELNQKQSRSVNDAVDGTGRIEGLITIGLTDIYDTNADNISSNPTTLEDKEYLVWGNNNASLDTAPVTVAVDMSSGITGLSTPVSFLGMQRIWKVIETGGDVEEVKVSIPQDAIRNINPPGSYYMFISDTPIFDPTADYRVMTADGNGNLEANYNFNATKYVTFGYAPQVIRERSVYFDGIADYIDIENNLNLNTTEFTLSSWIKRDTGTTNASILSKRNFINTEGYDLRINASGRLAFTLNGFVTSLTSSVEIPENEWHQVAVIYSSGAATLYIDGVADTSATGLPAPIATSQKFLIAAADGFDPNTTDYFAGNIDEVRVWDAALTNAQLQYIMNQEIVDNSNFVSGKIVPTTITKNDIAVIPWNQLAGYYPMSIYTYTNTDDASGNGHQGALRNLNTVDFQTAPLPYKSAANGDWDTNANWLNGSVQTIPGTNSIVDNTLTVDWNIVETSHDLALDNNTLPATSNNNRQVLSLNVIANKLTVTGDTSTNSGNGLTVSHYLNIDGKIDLNGESQLIQTTGSDLDETSSGTIERDQQGTEDLYTYNYWGSPVGVSNTTTNNNSYTIPDVLFDGSNVATPQAINYITNSYNGTPTVGSGPIGIADYWIWKYANLSTNYYNWHHVRSTGTMAIGEGFTMKGVDDTSGNVLLQQNYIFEGKPNNGDISLTIDNESDYLVGNPYASAMDADKFILDNTDTTGAVYYWEHFGGGTHNTSGYQGGYATYNLSGGVPAIQYNYATGANDPTGGNGTKTPGRFIPVAQGFFVNGTSSGTINFNNNQRVFQKENASSVFLKSNQSTNNPNQQLDTRLKIRLGFSTVDSFKRQLLVTRDTNATDLIDFGYDAENTEALNTDVYWIIDTKKFAIQGTNIIESTTILPLGIKTSVSGINTFNIDALENVPNDLEIFIYDTVIDSYYDIKNNPEFTIDLPAGEYLDRFELRFANASALSTEDFEAESGIQFYFANNNETIVISNPKFKVIKTVELFNILGQSILKFDDIETENSTELKTSNIATGAYILEITTNEGKLSKKVLVE